MTIEIWKTIFGYPCYEVSNLGRVRSWHKSNWSDGKRPKMLNGSFDRDGYRKVNLAGPDGATKKFKVSKLVALAHLGPTPIGKVVAHENGKANDDRASNLRHKTQLENIRDKYRHQTILTGRQHQLSGEKHHFCKLTEAAVLEIRSSSIPGKILATRFRVSPSLICLIKKRRIWRWL